jgi:murein DD-endopeptidase MepM/ murein hydrolase activator NlpD
MGVRSVSLRRVFNGVILLALALLCQGCPWLEESLQPYVQEESMLYLDGDELLHIVARGETVWSIARLYGVQPRVMTARNEMSGETLRPGQLLAIPGPDPAAAPAQPAVVQRPALEGVGGAPPTSENWLAKPVDGRLIRRYGADTPTGPARGIDLAATAGSEVRAAKTGRVRFVSHALRGMGKVVILEHAAGEWTLYGHMGTIRVEPGDRVPQGLPIGTVGHTGRADSDRLHFRVYRGGRPQDPGPLR